MKTRILSALLCAVLLVTLIPAAAMTVSAETAVEGDWTTFLFASEYEQEDYDTCTRPESGYEYTEEGFTVIPPDYKYFSPQLSVATKEPQAVKEGIYLQFRVDDYSYGGENNSDQWIALTLNTEEKVAPGSLQYGGGWMALIRGMGDGTCTNMSHLTEPETDDSAGSFVFVDSHDVAVPRDNQGREIYTLEISWDGSAYEMKLNGQVIPGSNRTTELLEKLNGNGDFYVGVQMYTGVKNGAAALTILKYGTCEADAVTPVGSDAKDVIECDFSFLDPADPSTVEPNMPAILWSPETVDIEEGYHYTFSVLEDNTWRVRLTDTDPIIIFEPKATWSYNAEDFPVFGILLRNFWADSGTLWYGAGEYDAPTSGLVVPFSVYDGEFYGEDDEYVFVPIDLSDLWEGRINGLRLDLVLPDEMTREFDLCFAGMFRSEDEAYAYAQSWLAPIYSGSGGCPVHPGHNCECALDETTVDETCIEPPYDPVPETEAPIWDTVPNEAITEVVSAVEDALYGEDGETVNVEDAVAEVLAKYGCTGSVGILAVLIPVLAAYVLKKKD